jgi:gentisate 1,2-dioxygenase
MQMIYPGEVARVHRHTLAAVRFIISGTGGYTVNDGEKFMMEAGPGTAMETTAQSRSFGSTGSIHRC